MVSGCGTLGPGPSGLGGFEGGHTVATGSHAERRPRPINAAPDSGPQQQNSDWPVSQSSAAGAGDRGHLQRVHPVSVLVLYAPAYHPTTE